MPLIILKYFYPKYSTFMFIMALCQRIPGHMTCSLSVKTFPQPVPFSHGRLEVLLSISFSLRKSCQCKTVCFTSSVKPVFSLFQLIRDFFTLYTPALQSTCLFRLGPHTPLMLSCSVNAVTASAGCRDFPLLFSLRANRATKPTYIYIKLTVQSYLINLFNLP